MGFDNGALNISLNISLEKSTEPDRDNPQYFFLDDDQEQDPAVAQLKTILRRSLPSIRNHLRRMVGDDSALHDYVDRLYLRLRGALGSLSVLNEDVVKGRLVSILHEDRRLLRKRFDPSGTEGIERAPDPHAFDFIRDIIRRDQLKAFRECLDPWMRASFDLRFNSETPMRPQEIAKMFKMKRNTFDKRWQRGLEAGVREYVRRHGPWV